MTEIKLTDAERVIIANQLEILSILKKDPSYDSMADDLRSGYSFLYNQYFESHIQPELSSDDVRHVLDILDIFGFMKTAFDSLPDKTGISDSDVEFGGFDGNNESTYLGFAHALLKHGRFKHVLGEAVKNSHMPTVHTHKRMIDKWKELGKPGSDMSKEMIIEIIGARIHPDNR